jgi:hypothetical protein
MVAFHSTGGIYEETSRYYALTGIACEVVRATSRLERTNRELRRKFRQVGCFSSPKRTEVAIYIQVTRLNAESGQGELVGDLPFPFIRFAPHQPLEIDTLPEWSRYCKCPDLAHT